MKIKQILQVLLLVICISVLTFSLYKIFDVFNEYSENKKMYDEMSDSYTIKLSTDSEIPSPSTKETAPISVDFQKLLEQNNDIIGWLYCEDTPINYPVLQSADNDYYLRRMINKKYNVAGSIFMDYRSKSDLSSLNTIIYGHNMKNDTMFGTFTEYKNQEYYDEHPVLWYLTPTCDYKIELFSGYVTSSNSDAYTDFKNSDDLTKYVDETKAKSTFKTNIKPTDISKIITLSTCSYEYATARFVLIGNLTIIENTQ